jgi:hypothetical protein
VGRHWIFLSLRLTMRTTRPRPVAAKLIMAHLSDGQMPSAGPVLRVRREASGILLTGGSCISGRIRKRKLTQVSKPGEGEAGSVIRQNLRGPRFLQRRRMDNERPLRGGELHDRRHRVLLGQNGLHVRVSPRGQSNKIITATTRLSSDLMGQASKWQVCVLCASAALVTRLGESVSK